MTRRRSQLLSKVAALAGVGILVVAIPQPAMAQPSFGGPDAAPDVAPEESPTGLWVVQLEDPPLATYAGGIAGLAPTSPQVAGGDQLDATAPASLAYRGHLSRSQDSLVTEIGSTLGRSVDVEFQYLNVLNAMAVRVDAAEAAQLAELPGVAAVYPDGLQEIQTDASQDLIGSPSIWNGDTGMDLPTRGEGVIVGMIDTGVNPSHPSFAAVDSDGYVHQNPFGSGNFVGVCDPAHPAHEPICNDKLIGAWNFHPSSPNAQDANGHGSHVGSTIAGNKHDATFSVGGDGYTRTIQGVAPRANVISYLVCFPTCPQTSSVAAVEQAILDGTDVLNFSISGVDDPWNNIVDLAFLDGFAAGIYIAASAGNAGPGASTVAHTGPWNATVAASTTGRIITHLMDVTAPDPVPPFLNGLRAVPSGDGPAVTADVNAEIRDADLVDPGNLQGCQPFPAGAFAGSVALIQRGVCAFADKVNNAAAAGAVAVVVFNTDVGPPTFMGGLAGTAVPAVMTTSFEGELLRDFIAEAVVPVEVTIHAGTELVVDPVLEDVVAGFSSRGPSQFEMINPTFAAPGVNILAAGAGGPDQYLIINGTSMASPHGAGSGALLKAAHPNWSPAEIRSALASTAVSEGVFKQDGNTADPFDIGSGRVNLDAAGRVGLVMDETAVNFEAADPATGGDPKTLNIPSMVDSECIAVCSWTRTVKAVAMVEATYTAVVDAPPGMVVTVTPSQFTLIPGTLDGATQELEITIDVTGMAPGDWAFADISFETGANHPTHGDFVPVAEPEISDVWTQRTVDLREYAGQEVCLAFSFKGFDAHTWRVDDVLVESDAGTHLNESFGDGTAFPPAGWAVHDFDAVDPLWDSGTDANTPPASAEHTFGGTGEPFQDGWLVSQQFTLGDNPSFTFFDDTAFLPRYVHSGVWVSTGSCDPTPTEGQPVSPVHYPIAVVPVQADPQITVDPDSLSAVQPPGQVTTQQLTIGNTGDLDLEWSLVESAAQRLPSGSSRVNAENRPDSTPDGRSLSTHPRLLGGVFGAPESVSPEAGTPEQGTVTLTHSASQSIVALNSAACSPDGGFSTTENGYLRHFVLDDFGITGDFSVTEVSFGIENLSVSQQVRVNLYEMVDPDGPFVYANFAEIGSATVSLPAQQMTLAQVPVSGSADGTLVVEIDLPDMSGVGAFFIGSNPQGQTAPSFLRSASCGLPEPTDTAAVGFPGMHMVINVTGTTDQAPGGCEPSDAPWLDSDPTSGTVEPGGQQVVEVSFDSTGLSGGDVLEATLCIESNDPDTPIVEVPVTLEVAATPVIEVSPDSLTAEVPAGDSADQTLTIGNLGNGTLDWTVGEATSLPAAGSASPAATPQSGFSRTTLGTNPDGVAGNSAIPEASPTQDGEVTLTHSASQAIVELNSVACTPGFGATTENGYLRHFVLEDFDITGPFEVTDVSFGIESINGPPHPVTVNLFEMIDPNGAFVYSNFREIGTTDVTLDPQALTIVEVPVSGVAAGTLVVEVETPDMTAQGGGLFIGSNPDGQTAPSFLRSASCGLPEPTDTAAIGVPTMHIVMNVTGVVDAGEPSACDTLADVPWLSVSPASGSTPAGGSSDVTVSFDVSGLDPGVFEAVLCVQSNDPATPLVEVPVTLTVTEPEALVCDETIIGVFPGPLTVSEGTTCLAAGAQVLGEVNVLEGAGLVATAAVIQGPVSAIGAMRVDVAFSQITGPVLVLGGTGRVSLFGTQVTGQVNLVSNVTAEPATVAGNVVIGSLSCFGNQPDPTNHGLINTATGGKFGQCAGL